MIILQHTVLKLLLIHIILQKRESLRPGPLCLLLGLKLIKIPLILRVNTAQRMFRTFTLTLFAGFFVGLLLLGLLLSDPCLLGLVHLDVLVYEGGEESEFFWFFFLGLDFFVIVRPFLLLEIGQQ